MGTDGMSRRAGRTTLAGLGLVLTATLSACGGYEPPDLTAREPIRVDSSTPSASAQPSGTATPTGTPSPTASSSEPPVLRAARVAATAADGTPVAVERTGDGPSWEFTVIDRQGREVVVVVSGDPERVQGGPAVSVDDDADDAQLVARATVDMARAVRAALRTQPGARLEQATLDEDDGVAAWEIELSTGAEVLVDARSGMVRLED